MRSIRTFAAASVVVCSALPSIAADVVADAVSQSNPSPSITVNASCINDVTLLSDGDFSRNGYCLNSNVPASHTITFAFSPSADERTTGLRIWSNAGGIYSDNEMRILDVAVDYRDGSGNPQTLVLNDVNIGDTANVPDSKVISFTGPDPEGLLNVTEVRVSDLRGRSGDANLPFREVNAIVISRPTVILSGTSTGPDAPFTVTATFSEGVTGVSASDFLVANGTASNLVQVSPTVFQFTVTPTPGTTAVNISLPANTVNDTQEGTPNLASSTLQVTNGSAPLTADEQRLVTAVRAEELKTLRQGLDRGARISRGARDRLALSRRCIDLDDPRLTPDEVEDCEVELATKHVPLTFDGAAGATGAHAHLIGQVTSMIKSADGQTRRLFFGAFDITDDSETGVIATLDGQIAWERTVSERTLWGVLVGAEVSLSDIEGELSGDRTRFGLSAGVYGARQIQGNIIADGFVVLGYGFNSLELSDATIEMDADYNAPSVLLGAAVSGERIYDQFELRPELAFGYGYTDIGSVSYETLTAGSGDADAGHVSLARLSLTPEMRFPFEIDHQGFDDSYVEVSPRLICEWVDAGDSSNDCGSGMTLGVWAASESTANRFSAEVHYEHVGDADRTTLTLTGEYRF